MSNPKKHYSSAKPALRSALQGYKITRRDGFNIDAFGAHDAPHESLNKKNAKHVLVCQKQELSSLQELLYANGTWAVLAIFQAMDAAGKDSTIKAVTSGINPQGVSVISFKAPGPEDLAHDFLRRISRALPARGMMGIFNRSHYEEVLAPRVHPDILAKQKLPSGLAAGDALWASRLEDIANYEAYLGRQGVKIAKFFLNVSRDEQRERLLERLDRPAKNWKFDPGDLRERELWPRYRAAYQAAIESTATVEAPWHVIPADRKWYTHLLVAEAIIEMLESLKLKTPKTSLTRKAMSEARQELAAT